MSVDKLVHCHVCPLKDLCYYNEQDASYRWHNQGRRKYRNGRLVVIQTKEDDLAKIQTATMNCPLKAILVEWQNKLLRQVAAH